MSNRTITATFLVPANYTGATPLQNTATVSSTTPDPNMLNNSATTSATVITRADLAVSKAYTLTGFAGAGTITYTITITNNGPSDAQSVSMVDALDPTTTQISATPSGGASGGRMSPDKSARLSASAH